MKLGPQQFILGLNEFIKLTFENGLFSTSDWDNDIGDEIYFLDYCTTSCSVKSSQITLRYKISPSSDIWMFQTTQMLSGQLQRANNRPLGKINYETFLWRFIPWQIQQKSFRISAYERFKSSIPIPYNQLVESFLKKCQAFQKRYNKKHNEKKCWMCVRSRIQKLAWCE